jgi:hypothetical protein
MEARQPASDWHADPSPLVKQEERGGESTTGGAGGAGGAGGDAMQVEGTSSPPAAAASIAHGWTPPGMPAAATTAAGTAAAATEGGIEGSEAAAAASGQSNEAELGQEKMAAALCTPGLCAKGHPLVPIPVETAGLKCDLCGKDIPVGDTTYSCEPCDFDQCSRCAGGGR